MHDITGDLLGFLAQVQAAATCSAPNAISVCFDVRKQQPDDIFDEKGGWSSRMQRAAVGKVNAIRHILIDWTLHCLQSGGKSQTLCSMLVI